MTVEIIRKVLKNTPKLQKDFIKQYYGKSNYKHYINVLLDFAVKDERNSKRSS